MSAKTTRIYKEARALFWPWCAVAVAGVPPLVHAPHWTGDLIMAWFLVGFSLLATLSFGNEFQHRTLSLLLAQPVERMEIWSEKLSVMAVAVLSAALILILAWRVSAIQLEPDEAAFFGAWIIAITASATYWTLFARSMLGGLALNVSINALVIEMPWLVLYHEKPVAVSLPPSNITVSTIAFVLLCYASVMLWLGRRKLARFQATGGVAGDDLLMSGPNVMPKALAAWFRCRPTGAFLNLIRKELRLLRSLWLITLMSVLGWTCLTMLRFVPEHGFGRLIPQGPGSPTFLLFFAVALMAALSVAIAILAGSLSLGEERTSGTHAWHMTLPVSARRQWLIKLIMALFAGFVCAALLPLMVVIAGGSLFGSPFMFVDPHGAMVWLITMPLLTFASFWCACAVNGTTRAAMWVFPILGALAIAGQFGGWVAEQLMGRVTSRLVLFLGSRFIITASKFPFNYITHFRLVDPVSKTTFTYDTGGQMGDFYLVATLFAVPILVVAMVQSYRLFRAQAQDSLLSLTRNLLPLATMALLLSFSFIVSGILVIQVKQQMWTMFYETHKAIEKIQPGIPNLDVAHPLELTVDDLAKASPLSETTRRWLRNSRITVAPDKGSGRYCCSGPWIVGHETFPPGRWNSGHDPFPPGKKFYPLYLATIHLASGSKCTLFLYGARLSFVDGLCE